MQSLKKINPCAGTDESTPLIINSIIACKLSVKRFVTLS